MAKDDRLYAKFTLEFPDSPKVLPLSDAAFRALVEIVIRNHSGRLAGIVPTDLYPVEALTELIEDGLLAWDDHSRLVIANPDDYPLMRPHRPAIPIEVRRQVMERDRFACVSCGSTDQLSLDHIVRFRDGGPDSVENLCVLCMPCNLERG